MEKVQFFVSCAPGLEEILAQEVKLIFKKPLITEQPVLGFEKQATGEERGGLLFSGKLEDIYECNLHLRTASRVIVRLGDFFAAAFSELRKKASRLQWEQYLRPGQALNLSVTCHKSKLYHSDAVAERVLGAINDHFPSTKKQCTLDKNGQLVLVRLVNDLCTISIDSSGELLHKRGYRQETAKAPLRETIAAAMLLSVGWDHSQQMIDPFCGSGTIPIEAALLASKIPPGIAREFAFSRWPVFDIDRWQEMLSLAKSGIVHPQLQIYGFDRDQGAIKAAQSNAARAGLLDVTRFTRQAISELRLSGENPGWIITNPPYGVRVTSAKDLRDLYARFGAILSGQFSGWQVGILGYDKRLTANLGLAQPAFSRLFVNGGLPVQYQVYKL